jgi:hypothetical protein
LAKELEFVKRLIVMVKPIIGEKESGYVKRSIDDETFHEI